MSGLVTAVHGPANASQEPSERAAVRRSSTAVPGATPERASVPESTTIVTSPSAS